MAYLGPLPSKQAEHFQKPRFFAWKMGIPKADEGRRGAPATMLETVTIVGLQVAEETDVANACVRWDVVGDAAQLAGRSRASPAFLDGAAQAPEPT